MGLFSKIKDYLSEEVEEEEVTPTPQKVEPVKPVVKQTQPVKQDIPKEEVTTVKKEEKFVFPVYFDDKDFDDISKQTETIKVNEKPKEEVKHDFYRENRESRENRDLYKDSFKETHRENKESYKEAYSKKSEVKEEKGKKFRPTPIISPVYGILDKNYYKEDIVVTPISRTNYYDSSKPMTIDDVRKKAYGTLEDDLEKSMFYTEESPKHGKTEDNIFDENDFANAIEEDIKRDISKDSLKSDIESLLDNQEFANNFNFHPAKSDKEKLSKKIEKETNDETYEVTDDLIYDNSEEIEESNNSQDYEINGLDEDLTEENTIENDEVNNDENEEDNLDLDITDSLGLTDSGEDNDELEIKDNDEDYTKENVSYEKSIYQTKEIPDKEIEKAYDDNEDLNDSDLFDLIDSMYEKENN